MADEAAPQSPLPPLPPVTTCAVHTCVRIVRCPSETSPLPCPAPSSLVTVQAAAAAATATVAQQLLVCLLVLLAPRTFARLRPLFYAASAILPAVRSDCGGRVGCAGHAHGRCCAAG